ncbi:uncharacterized protein LOC127256709 [Andrographis paniculata]|uniref:uncharacterized protein LOC127256709 n=1 Tax=Andrographis paniculata TaxID=175694 RepID=UPI0021E86FA5|nr:uncharacterized protein LOC127256709 [Andrographis paniculata]
MATVVELQNRMEPWFELDKVVMVTGASSGLGWEFCLDLAESGCRVIAAARRADRLESLCSKINEIFPQTAYGEPVRACPTAVAVELDISASEKVIASRVNEAWDIFGKIDVLINNAGARERLHGPLDLSCEEWDKIIRTNQTGTWLVSKCVCRRMREARLGGSIINVSSLAALDRVVFHGGHAYAASKAALNTITKVMAMELGEYNVRVNAIVPGLLKSEITRELMQKSSLENAIVRTVPLHSFGTVNSALGSIVKYLIYESPQYVTGNVFIVDGGYTLAGVPIFSSL